MKTVEDTDGRLNPESIVAGSGPYSYGMAYCEVDDVERKSLSLEGKLTPAGAYTILVSSYEREETGAFTLTVESSSPVTISPIPQEGAGMYSRTILGRW